MMCVNCRTAGDLNQAHVRPSLIRGMHDMCEYPASCTCQHGVGSQWVKI